MSKPFVVVVTGANRGIGEAIVHQVSAHRAQHQSMVIYAASRGGVDLGLKGATTSQVHYPKLDITNEQSVQNLATAINKEHGRVDVLINNAGLNIQSSAPSGLRAFEDQKKIMDVNFKGTLRVCQAFIPLMKPDGRIVNLSSVASGLKQYGEGNRARFRDPKLSIEDLEEMAAEFEVGHSAVSGMDISNGKTVVSTKR